MNDIQQLNEILGKNPFTKDLVDGWRANLTSGSLTNEYVLPCDIDFLGLCAEQTKEAAHIQVLTHLLPQPFAGSPLSDTWILLYNPGYSPVDEFDNLSVANKAEVFQRILPELSTRCLARRTQSVSDFFVNRTEEDDARCLRRRQSLMLNQLVLDAKTKFPFFWLDQSFCTVNKRSVGNKLMGGHIWWRSMLLNADGSMRDFLRHDREGVTQDRVYQAISGAVFVLEYFPYHSRNFGRGVLKRNGWLSIQNGYHEFWVSMVKYAMQNGKTIIVRNKWMVDGSFCGDCLLEPGRYLEFKGEKCYLNCSNLQEGRR